MTDDALVADLIRAYAEAPSEPPEAGMRVVLAMVRERDKRTVEEAVK